MNAIDMMYESIFTSLSRTLMVSPALVQCCLIISEVFCLREGS